jgi:predicted nucleic acid-binding protein
MIVVSDNSPLQYLILIECIDALPALYGQVLTTPQVIQELSQAETPDSVRAWVKSLPVWLKVESPLKVDFLDTIDVGEASAISLAQERDADLVLIDERAGTDAARRVGIQVVGTLGVLIEAGAEGLVDFEAALNQLTTQTSFYASRNLIESARRIFLERKRKQQGTDSSGN